MSHRVDSDLATECATDEAIGSYVDPAVDARLPSLVRRVVERGPQAKLSLEDIHGRMAYARIRVTSDPPMAGFQVPCDP